jgi:hypothetical protein
MVESMNGARFVHDQLEAAGWQVEIADRSGLRRAYERAMARNVEQLAIFTHDLFSTPHDQANRAAIADVPAADLHLAGIALHANRRTVDKILDKLRPHP